MQQVTQKLKSGEMRILDVPVPDPRAGNVLVRNHYSLISAGTEASAIKAARKGYIGKALERPQQLKQVIETFKTQGPRQTYRSVMKKLDAYSPLGYSCVGEVIDVAPDVDSIRTGDFVACGGNAHAHHAEVVAVPKNLCVKIPMDTDLRASAYNTLGAIALQGIRQAGLHLSETCAVIGLGLIGQLTAILLRASGVRVIGIDIAKPMVDIARQHCIDLALQREQGDIESVIREFTNGIGCDSVIITAASDSLDPINFAGSICRKRATVVVVGDVPTGFDRAPHYYMKELTVRMSCSYGPGRYDSEYEEKGRDYPVGYVRWTENRNMQAFQDLIHHKKIDVNNLTTHQFDLEEVPKAYDMILNRSEPFIGILVRYDAGKRIQRSKIKNGVAGCGIKSATGIVSVGFIGAGSYAQSHLLPNIPNDSMVSLAGVMTSTSISSRSAMDRFGFEFCTTGDEDILGDDRINTVFIATRHDSHAYYARKALAAGKHVFVEKPLCITSEELASIEDFYLNTTFHEGKPILMVGFNRRFSPLVDMIREKFKNTPMSIIYRINAGYIPRGSWIQDLEMGGGRIVGEVCHFVDLLTYLNGSPPLSIYAADMRDAQGIGDTLTLSMQYSNGSLGSIHYFTNGSNSIPKEYLEVNSHGLTAVLTDFRELEIHGERKPFKKRLPGQDKGQKLEIRRFIESILEGGAPPIPIDDIFTATRITLKIVESIKTGKVITLSGCQRLE